jgi:exodeoxyribonuclease-3
VRIVTWNVNSIRAREGRVRTWLEQHRPDVLCLQELKVEDAGFPHEVFAPLGYEVALIGQRSYNGVAIAALGGLRDVVKGFGDGGDDEQARFVSASVAASGVRVACCYVPNGQALDSDKFVYKLEWLGRLRRWLDAHVDRDAPLAVCADWNVTPADLDVHDPAKWAGHLHCSEPERAALREVVGWGLTDCYRAANPEGRAFSWWDYRGVAFFKDYGLRIDMIYASPPLAARLTGCEIDRAARKGQDASDHAPVIATFADPG